MNLEVKLGTVKLKNPVMPASGTFGFGYEFSKYYDLNVLGAIALKGTTLEYRYGNNLPRIAETSAGMLNSIGLQNPGIKDVFEVELPKLNQVYTGPLVANIGGSTIDQYVEVAKVFDKIDNVAILELNVSCPNVEHGGISIGTNEKLLEQLVTKIKENTTKPLYVKLSPNVTDIVTMAKTCEKAGADGLVLINTLVGMRIDIKTKKPILANNFGGLSGPCIKPVALKMVYQVYQNVSIPIIGVGGISNAQDVIEMMLAGASAVQIGTENLVNPYACRDIIEQLPILMEELNISDISTIVGAAHE